MLFILAKKRDLEMIRAALGYAAAGEVPPAGAES